MTQRPVRCLARLLAGAGLLGGLALGAAACGAGDNGGTIQTPPTSTTTTMGGSPTSSTLPGGS